MNNAKPFLLANQHNRMQVLPLHHLVLELQGNRAYPVVQVVQELRVHHPFHYIRPIRERQVDQALLGVHLHHHFLGTRVHRLVRDLLWDLVVQVGLALLFVLSVLLVLQDQESRECLEHREVLAVLELPKH